MSHILSPGQQFTLNGDLHGSVDEYLGGGGQGEVYRARLGRSDVALKWYFPHNATQKQRTRLEELVRKGSPDPRFLWPEGIATADGTKGFGYVMPLRPKRYRSIVDILTGRTSPSFKALATAGYHLASGYLALHAGGLCYHDLSHGNAFFDPSNGDVLICDNDNVSVDGVAGAGVLGTPRYMAPEVVVGSAKPSADTDRYSLGVLLFYMFFVHHPLDGAREQAIRVMNLPAMQKLYGSEPVFVFDPDDASNRPVPGAQDNALIYWNLYPQSFRDLFTRHFTDGLHNPGSRVRESEWIRAMADLRDALLYCPCGAENFYDRGRIAAHGPASCWACDRPLKLPPRLRVNGSNVILLNHDTALYPHHVTSSVAEIPDFSTSVAEMSQHPKKPSIWGLKNTSSARWVVTHTDGAMTDVEPGQTVRLSTGVRINFGQVEAEVRA